MHVDGQIRFKYDDTCGRESFQIRNKNMLIKKYPDKCGLGLGWIVCVCLVGAHLNIVGREFGFAVHRAFLQKGRLLLRFIRQ